MSFANRHSDFDALNQAIDELDVVFLIAGPAFGITSFLHEHTRRNSSKSFYVNVGVNKSIASELLTKVIHSESISQLQELANEKWGERDSTTPQALLEAIPYAGPLLSHFADKKSAAPVYAGNYMNALAELLVPLFEDMAKKIQVEIIIDAAQDMDENSYSLIASLSSIKNVTTIITVTENNDRYLKIKNHLEIYSKLHIDTILFGEPDHHLVSELAKSYGYELTDSEITGLLLATQKNIHRIIEAISNYSHPNDYLDPIEKGIVYILDICANGLSQEVLCSILQLSNIFSKNIFNDTSNALTQLYEKNLVTTKISLSGDKSYVLVGRHHPLVESCLTAYTDSLYYRNLVFEYFEKNGIGDSLENAELMYSLSKELLQKSSKSYAVLILDKKLKSGETIPEEIILAAKLDKRSSKDITLATLYYCRERRYNDALGWLESLRNKKNVTFYSNLKAVLLNRVRRMDEAELLFKQCLETEHNQGKLNILYAYSLANTLHLHGSSTIKDLYLTSYEKLSGTPNNGYFARNFASAVPAKEKESFYMDAVASFKENRDDFGLYSSYCNWGNSLCVIGRPQDAFPYLANAEKGLQQFGTAHLHIVYNDIGMCHFMNKEYSDASKYLSLATRLALNTMPYVMVEINKACLALASDDKESAHKIMMDVLDKVTSHKVASLKQKYYTNMLLVQFALGVKPLNTFMKEHEENIAEYVNADIVSKYAEFIRAKCEYSSKHLHNLYYPSGLAYWYIDPLKLI